MSEIHGVEPSHSRTFDASPNSAAAQSEASDAVRASIFETVQPRSAA